MDAGGIFGYNTENITVADSTMLANSALGGVRCAPPVGRTLRCATPVGGAGWKPQLNDRGAQQLAVLCNGSFGGIHHKLQQALQQT